MREIARKAGLPTAEKKDSQGICFLGKISLEDFLKQYIPKKQGDVLDVFGKKIGKHKGAHFYTIGQRHGLGIGGSEKPYYVVEKNVKKNIIVVAEGDDNSALYKKRIELTDVNFINQQLLINNQQQQVLMRVRYRQPLINAVLRQSALKSASIRALFEKPQKAVAPGQSAVFYNKAGEMLGGGTIDKIL